MRRVVAWNWTMNAPAPCLISMEIVYVALLMVAMKTTFIKFLFIKSMTRFINPASAVVLAIFLPGCAGKPVIQTQVIEKAIAVPCVVKTPPECKSAYAVDRVSTKDDAVTINRALRAEIEERWACEIKLRAALKGCNKTMEDATDTETAGS
ncbi:hypothetical protein SAMN05216386_0706 [Nitrosospira briensis]|uniref:Uncharacterized protein n=1 Tax=Nitrosospira briensis TaxID=35799 RepID=A0A1I4YHK9_9PROT|nr:hypothetical protein [Nitrosospira briensis]SFN37544.1 hypothetical protein SAMN05216386_0706 [Nitrosospira briensis]